MATRNTARVMVGSGEAEQQVDFYVRAVAGGRPSFTNPAAGEADKWAAYRSEPHLIVGGRRLEAVARESDAPRETVESAAADMWDSIAALMQRDPTARLTRGEMPKDLADEVAAHRVLMAEAAKDPRLASDLADA